MAKFDLKPRAIKLRREGKTLNEIMTVLSISKSTASYWCRDIKISDVLKKDIKKNHILKTQRGRLIGAEMNKKKKLDAIKIGSDFGKKFVKNINNREIGLIATALYWSEGAKADGTFGFQFINSDPDMIIVMKKFLTEVVGVSNEELVCSIQINETHRDRIAVVLNFWQNLLELSSAQIRNPYFVSTKSSKVYENHDRYYGICRLMVRKSTLLKYKMLGLISAMKENIMSA